MRDRTKRRNHSPEAERFRQEHARDRERGLQQRHALKLWRLRRERAAAAQAMPEPARTPGPAARAPQRSRTEPAIDLSGRPPDPPAELGKEREARQAPRPAQPRPAQAPSAATHSSNRPDTATPDTATPNASTTPIRPAIGPQPAQTARPAHAATAEAPYAPPFRRGPACRPARKETFLEVSSSPRGRFAAGHIRCTFQSTQRPLPTLSSAPSKSRCHRERVDHRKGIRAGAHRGAPGARGGHQRSVCGDFARSRTGNWFRP